MKLGRLISSEFAINRDGEDPDLLMEAEITEPNDEKTVEYGQAAHVDARPPADTSLFILQLSESWLLAIGADDGVTKESAEGEYEIYSILNGAKAGRLKLFTDGKIRFQNAAGYVELKASGQVDINGNFTVDP